MVCHRWERSFPGQNTGNTFLRTLLCTLKLMKYCQIDEISSLEPGKKLVARRTLRAQEDYLLDHFPRFPVMPGVMMLEALHQAAIWLIRTGDDFASPLVLLREARNVKFGDFLSPGETLEITAEAIKREGTRTTVKAAGQKGGRVTVSARLILEQCDSGDPDYLGTDADIRARNRAQFTKLFGDPAAS
jgi:3-hydroxyacyl-[acyl-carrier-protein] dehydratase